MYSDLIEEYENGGDKLKRAIRGLTDADLNQFPVPGSWSIRQIVIHLMDSDLIAADRMKRVIAEDNPTLIGFDETRFAQNLFYQTQPVEDALTIFDLNRRMFATVLRLLPDEAFARKGTHNERGEQTLADILRYMVQHVEHHLKFVYQKRELLGKLMW